ncbi:MAG: hypothetical protein LUI06_03010 [Ruminococcus sp.]|nr:hypothetical protein [Ruminococcus sp.]
MPYTITCKSCGKSFESDSSRTQYCDACRKTMRGRTNTAYRDRTYDRATFYMPKGNKEYYQSIAAHFGMSLNEFITTAINEYMDKLEKDGKFKDK